MIRTLAKLIVLPLAISIVSAAPVLATTGEPREVIVGKDDLEFEPVEVTVKVTEVNNRFHYRIGFHQKTGGPAKGDGGIRFRRDGETIFHAMLKKSIEGEWALFSFSLNAELLPIAGFGFGYGGPGVGGNGLVYRVPLNLYRPKD